jgi:hypothetical protein
MTADADLVGAEVGTTSFPVERGKIREFAAAVLEEDRFYFDDPNPPAPPTFAMTMALWSHGLGPQLDLCLDSGTIFHGEQEFTYAAPIKAGDTLTAVSRVVDASTTETSPGESMRFLTIESRFANQRGEEVLIGRAVIVQKGSHGGQP